MSIDRSLKVAGGLSRHRNVLSRAERIQKLSTTGKFDPDSSNPLGLVKVANRKVAAAAKPAKKADAAAEGAAAAPAAGGKAAAPAAAAGGDKKAKK